MIDPNDSPAPTRPGTDVVLEPVLDLTTCDREPVHLAGAIQPHGALLVLTEPDLRVVQASANVGAFLGLPEQPLAGQPLAAFLDQETIERLRARLAAIDLAFVLAHLTTLTDRPGGASARPW